MMTSEGLMASLCGLALALVGLAFGLQPRGARAEAADAKSAPDEVTNQVTQGALRFKGADGKYLECPLKHTDVQAEVSGFIARVKVTQTFVNSAKERTRSRRFTSSRCRTSRRWTA